MAKKEEVAEVLKIILDGLTAGESSEKKLEETKKFYETELAKVNEENRFYQSIIKVILFGEYVSNKRATFAQFAVSNGAKLFQHQMEANSAYSRQPKSGSVFDFEEFNNFVNEYLAAARKDKFIGIKEEK